MNGSLRGMDRYRSRTCVSVAWLALLSCTFVHAEQRPPAASSDAAVKPFPSNDTAWYDQRAVLKRFPPKYDGVVRTSRYITMRDGCRIAVDVFLPDGLEPGKRLPTMLHQTRYWRYVAFNGPLAKLAKSGRIHEIRDFFVVRGYAWVATDVRGSGASFGYRPCEYSPDEIRDGKDIVDWIVAQPWSDGTVGATGVSYDGGTAELLASNRHPAVKAIAPLFSMFDPYLEVVYPGGVHLSWFTEVWGRLGQQLDRNIMPDLVKERFGPLATLAAKGVSPVDADRDGSILAQAVRSHAYNWDLHETVKKITFRDDRLPYTWSLGFASMSPYVKAGALDEAGVAVYSYSGWYDAAFAHSAIKRYITLRGKANRLTLGPWNHGGKIDCTPPGARRSRFDRRVELFRFFEHHLRGTETGIADEPPIHYFTMVANAWHATDTWPPKAQQRMFYLAADGLLNDREKPKQAGDACDAYTVDRTHGTGDDSRWDCLVLSGRVVYPDRAEQDGKLLCYTTPPLEADFEVTGHPVVTLHVTHPHEDGHVFAYLEDVAPDGTVSLLTEGMLRAVHRKLSDAKPPYPHCVPYRTFRRADALPLVPGEPAELTFDLLPVSYLFKKGHRIRLAVGGADVDHFAAPPGPPPTIKVHRSASRPSRIVLPVVRR